MGSNGVCCKKGPGFATPLEAMSGPREALLYSETEKRAKHEAQHYDPNGLFLKKRKKQPKHTILSCCNLSWRDNIICASATSVQEMLLLRSSRTCTGMI
ncbi:hypothetical protein RJ641_001723 [Dillenia turbinata]|uniref:Uncharacterized protein n=1 Tax=Dillenia turbinata TaxID=194707 RepID=A0AAN8Z9T6_9MAGN